MEKLLKQLIESANKNKKGLKLLKSAAVSCQQYELAGQLREIERNKFPETLQERKEKENAEKLNLLFRMVELHISNETCWIINETLEVFKKKKGKFAISDAAIITYKAKEIFDNE